MSDVLQALGAQSSPLVPFSIGIAIGVVVLAIFVWPRRREIVAGWRETFGVAPPTAPARDNSATDRRLRSTLVVVALILAAVAVFGLVTGQPIFWIPDLVLLVCVLLVLLISGRD